MQVDFGYLSGIFREDVPTFYADRTTISVFTNINKIAFES